jgi:hypothetical protein
MRSGGQARALASPISIADIVVVAERALLIESSRAVQPARRGSTAPATDVAARRQQRTARPLWRTHSLDVMGRQPLIKLAIGSHANFDILFQHA